MSTFCLSSTTQTSSRSRRSRPRPRLAAETSWGLSRLSLPRSSNTCRLSGHQAPTHPPFQIRCGPVRPGTCASRDLCVFALLSYGADEGDPCRYPDGVEDRAYFKGKLNGWFDLIDPETGDPVMGTDDPDTPATVNIKVVFEDSANIKSLGPMNIPVDLPEREEFRPPQAKPPKSWKDHPSWMATHMDGFKSHLSPELNEVMKAASPRSAGASRT